MRPRRRADRAGGTTAPAEDGPPKGGTTNGLLG